jgi:hypothetical protein
VLIIPGNQYAGDGDNYNESQHLRRGKVLPNWRFISIPVLQLPIFSVIISLSFICHSSRRVLVRIGRVFVTHIILAVAGAADDAPEQLSGIPT